MNSIWQIDNGKQQTQQLSIMQYLNLNSIKIQLSY